MVCYVLWGPTIWILPVSQLLEIETMTNDYLVKRIWQRYLKMEQTPKGSWNFQLSNTALVLYHLTRTQTVATIVNLKFMQSMALLLFILIPLIAAHYLKTSAMTWCPSTSHSKISSGQNLSLITAMSSIYWQIPQAGPLRQISIHFRHKWFEMLCVRYRWHTAHRKLSC